MSELEFKRVYEVEPEYDYLPRKPQNNIVSVPRSDEVTRLPNTQKQIKNPSINRAPSSDTIT